MNENERINNEEQDLVDRLVDGELDDAQQRDLLLRLEGLPDGWRRCALAFVESQTWGREFKSMRALGNLDNPLPNAVDSITARNVQGGVKTWWRGPTGSFLGMAASFLLAFGLGLAWRTWDGVDLPLRQGPLANSSPNDARPQTVPGAEPSTEPSGTRWATVSMPMQAASGETEQFEMPVVEGPDINAQWLVSQPSALPGHLLRELERRGHRVLQNRQFIPFQLDDGRQVVFPVDQVDVRYVGERIIP